MQDTGHAPWPPAALPVLPSASWLLGVTFNQETKDVFSGGESQSLSQTAERPLRPRAGPAASPDSSGEQKQPGGGYGLLMVNVSQHAHVHAHTR